MTSAAAHGELRSLPANARRDVLPTSTTLKRLKSGSADRRA